MDLPMLMCMLMWIFGGFFVGLAFAVTESRWEKEDPYDDISAPPGANLLLGWALAPLFVAGCLIVGLVWVLGKIVTTAEKRVPLTRSQMQHKISKLEKELEI